MEKEKGKSKNMRGKNWGHSAARKCRRALRGRSRRTVPPTETARALKGPNNPSEPGTYKEVLTDTKIAIFREIYPEDKLTEYRQNFILEILGKVLRGTPIGELPR
jgi:hypothetical protein